MNELTYFLTSCDIEPLSKTSIRTTMMLEVDDTAAAIVQLRISMWIRFLEAESDDFAVFRVVALS